MKIPLKCGQLWETTRQKLARHCTLGGSPLLAIRGNTCHRPSNAATSRTENEKNYVRINLNGKESLNELNAFEYCG
jgi:hypothetical protein